ncbi:MAG: arsenate reductase ArsC [Candidatus Omnitrophica bacterium]|nr:arsenate reductase ArsC [Candidatus Omnitrophota bacterium]
MKKVLFVCIENSCRSQIAEGFACNLGGGIIEPYSAGSRPSVKINPEAVRVMQELGIDISSRQSKGFDQLPVKEFDFVITLGCQDVCPFVPAKQHIDWNITDPKGKDAEFFRKVRDDIADKVKDLIRTCQTIET